LNFGFGAEPAQISVPTTLLWRVHPNVRRNEYDMAVLHVNGNLDMDAVQKQAEKLLSARHAKDNLRIFSAESLKSILGNVTIILQALLGAIAGLSLLVGGIGIMNIMLVSVTERTREIGLRKALGATSGQIRWQFLAEAMALTFVGGIIGVLLAAGVLWLIVQAVPFFKVFVLSLSTITLALSVSILVGLFFGVWPAARAAKLDPIESLRYE
jgi:putative ABC transport system permease protein